MRIPIKLLPVLCFLLLIPWPGRAADTLKINLTYKHKLDDAGRTQGYITINQKFYTPDQTLFREINFDEKSGQIATYVFYFYIGNKLSTEECYNPKDTLLYILKHEYDATGRENQVTRFEPVHGSLMVTHKTLKLYDKSGNIIKQREYSGKKLGTSIVFGYNNQGAILMESRKFKPVSLQPLKSETRLYEYNGDKSVKQVSVTGKDAANKPFQRNEEYNYNDRGLLSSIRISGTEYPAGLIKTYKYLNGGALSLYQESDATGKISLLLQYDYKKHFMDKGTQESYFIRKK